MENTQEPNLSLIVKHGLSIYIETEKQKLLFDTGPDDSFLYNARDVGVDLKKVDTLVISHAHYDHGGGLEEFLKLNDHARVFLSSGVKGEYFAQRSETEFESIGLNPVVLEIYKNRLHFIEDKTVISPGITLLTTTEQYLCTQSSTITEKRGSISKGFL